MLYAKNQLNYITLSIRNLLPPPIYPPVLVDRLTYIKLLNQIRVKVAKCFKGGEIFPNNALV